MNIYIYSDESGVLDKFHNDYYVFAGLIFATKDSRDNCSRKYIKAENTIRNIENLPQSCEIKATSISNKSKSKLFRSLNQIEKFGIVIHQNKLFNNMFKSKKTKQRYLDWAYKMAVKNKFEHMISANLIMPNHIERLFFYIDEHTTATDGKYELKESIEQEFHYGSYNWEHMIHHNPLFPNLLEVQLNYCNSKVNTLVRGADIVANKLYHMATTGTYNDIKSDNFNVIHHPQ